MTTTRHDRDRQLATLVRASRVAARRGGMRARTHYLTAGELRTVPVTRLLRETAWADRPGTSQEWGDQRRAVLADEFARRGFHEAAEAVAARREAAEYDAHTLVEQQRREVESDTELREPAAERDRAEETVVLVAVSTLAAAEVAVTADSTDVLLEQVTSGLDRAWEELSSDPAIGGDWDMAAGADLSDSLAAEAGQAPAAAVEAAVAPVEVEHEREL